MSLGNVTRYGYRAGEKPRRCSNCDGLWSETRWTFTHRKSCPDRYRFTEAEQAMWDRVDASMRGGHVVHAMDLTMEDLGYKPEGAFG